MVDTRPGRMLGAATLVGLTLAWAAAALIHVHRPPLNNAGRPRQALEASEEALAWLRRQMAIIRGDAHTTLGLAWGKIPPSKIMSGIPASPDSWGSTRLPPATTAMTWSGTTPSPMSGTTPKASHAPAVSYRPTSTTVTSPTTTTPSSSRAEVVSVTTPPVPDTGIILPIVHELRPPRDTIKNAVDGATAMIGDLATRDTSHVVNDTLPAVPHPQVSAGHVWDVRVDSPTISNDLSDDPSVSPRPQLQTGGAGVASPPVLRWPPTHAPPDKQLPTPYWQNYFMNQVIHELKTRSPSHVDWFSPIWRSTLTPPPPSYAKSSVPTELTVSPQPIISFGPGPHGSGWEPTQGPEITTRDVSEMPLHDQNYLLLGGAPLPSWARVPAQSSPYFLSPTINPNVTLYPVSTPATNPSFLITNSTETFTTTSVSLSTTPTTTTTTTTTPTTSTTTTALPSTPQTVTTSSTTPTTTTTNSLTTTPATTTTSASSPSTTPNTSTLPSTAPAPPLQRVPMAPLQYQYITAIPTGGGGTMLDGGGRHVLPPELFSYQHPQPPLTRQEYLYTLQGALAQAVFLQHQQERHAAAAAAAAAVTAATNSSPFPGGLGEDAEPLRTRQVFPISSQDGSQPSYLDPDYYANQGGQLAYLVYPDYEVASQASVPASSSSTSNMELLYPWLALGQSQLQNQSQSVVNEVHSYQNLVIQLANGTNVTSVSVTTGGGAGDGTVAVNGVSNDGGSEGADGTSGGTGGAGDGEVSAVDGGGDGGGGDGLSSSGGGVGVSGDVGGDSGTGNSSAGIVNDGDGTNGGSDSITSSSNTGSDSTGVGSGGSDGGSDSTTGDGGSNSGGSGGTSDGGHGTSGGSGGTSDGSGGTSGGSGGTSGDSGGTSSDTESNGGTTDYSGSSSGGSGSTNGDNGGSGGTSGGTGGTIGDSGGTSGGNGDTSGSSDSGGTSGGTGGNEGTSVGNGDTSDGSGGSSDGSGGTSDGSGGTSDGSGGTSDGSGGSSDGSGGSSDGSGGSSDGSGDISGGSGGTSSGGGSGSSGSTSDGTGGTSSGGTSGDSGGSGGINNGNGGTSDGSGSGSASGGSGGISGGSTGTSSGGISGDNGGNGGTSDGNGGTSDGSGGTSDGSGGTSVGSGGTSDGSGGTSDGSGGPSVGSGGTSDGSGGTSDGSGGTSVGSGGTSDGSGGTSGGNGGASDGSGGTPSGGNGNTSGDSGGASTGSTGSGGAGASAEASPSETEGTSRPEVYRCNERGGATMTNFVNPSYPYRDTAAGICMFRLDLQPSVCQVRVDVVETNLAAPTEGVCVRQYLTVQGTVWRPGLRRLCGTNSDTHFYLEVEEGVPAPYVEVAVASQAGLSYRWGLWITQIDCLNPSPLRAPTGCFQYFPESSGVLKSFSFDDGQYYVDQHYRLCLGVAPGTCSVTFTSQPRHFMIEKYGNTDEVPFDRSGMSSLYCVRDYLRIPEGSADGSLYTASHDRYCGGHLAHTHGAAAPSPVTSRVTSRVVALEFHAGIPHKFMAKAHGPGFKILYQHNPCVPQDTRLQQALPDTRSQRPPVTLPPPPILKVTLSPHLSPHRDHVMTNRQGLLQAPFYQRLASSHPLLYDPSHTRPGQASLQGDLTGHPTRRQEFDWPSYLTRLMHYRREDHPNGPVPRPQHPQPTKQKTQVFHPPQLPHRPRPPQLHSPSRRLEAQHTDSSHKETSQTMENNVTVDGQQNGTVSPDSESRLPPFQLLSHPQDLINHTPQEFLAGVQVAADCTGEMLYLCRGATEVDQSVSPFKGTPKLGPETTWAPGQWEVWVFENPDLQSNYILAGLGVYCLAYESSGDHGAHEEPTHNNFASQMVLAGQAKPMAAHSKTSDPNITSLLTLPVSVMQPNNLNCLRTTGRPLSMTVGSLSYDNTTLRLQGRSVDAYSIPRGGYEQGHAGMLTKVNMQGTTHLLSHDHDAKTSQQETEASPVVWAEPKRLLTFAGGSDDDDEGENHELISTNEDVYWVLCIFDCNGLAVAWACWYTSLPGLLRVSSLPQDHRPEEDTYRYKDM
ncbi:LOW QUALITY PROTEIN: uncharacterized protein [Panulirus ornatus]|uniref:LOW QUALITY PROTEIN: uncharacterized protein n=1 Tax=Panulirus ornatus TaxID=150431 RepID=UPI003A898E76